MSTRILLGSCLISFVCADLRMSSHPKNGYGLNQGGSTRFNRTGGKLFHRYMIPSVFAYKGLKYPGGQKYNNYDNFLRSNIDNEQDNRNFNDERGEDHLPFRTMRGTVDKQYRNNRFDGATPRPVNLVRSVKPGESLIVPLRWNNPHAAELEVNVWIFDHLAGDSKGTGNHNKKHPIVIPIRKPTCSGEGHQDNAVIFTIPKDFTKLGSKIPGFKGCTKDSNPMCTLQIYSHSVESRQYALGFPITVPGHETGLSTTSMSGIEPMKKDPWMEIYGLREICLPSTDPSADIVQAVPRWSRLVSDVYTHSYMNSDFSPYSGQQQEYISQNLQTSAINKMVTGNRGELGASILTREQASRIAQLSSLEDTIYKNYEALANKIIKRLGRNMRNGGNLNGAGGLTQPTATCFRCGEVGSVTTRRQETNTYIPSFQLPESLLAQAKGIVPSKYSSLITSSGVVQIYRASLMDLAPFFFVSHPLGVIYQEAELKEADWNGNFHSKPAMNTKADKAFFKKRDASGNKDGGKYASLTAKLKFAEERGCPEECIYGKITCPGATFKPLFNGASNTCVSGTTCAKCSKLYDDYQLKSPPEITPLARLVAKSGLPRGMGEDAVAPYPDTDGSPRFGRPTSRPGERPIPPANSTWDLGKPKPTKAPTSPPTPAPTEPPTDAPPAPQPVIPQPSPGPERRRREVRRRRQVRRRRGVRRRRQNGKGGKTSRRRSTRRRRRKTPKGPARRRGSSSLTEQLRASNLVLGDVEPLPEGDCDH